MKAGAISLLFILLLVQDIPASAQTTPAAESGLGESAVPDASESFPEAGAVYVDQLMEGLAEEEIPEDLEEVPEGRRRITAEYRFFGIDTSNRGEGSENGVFLRAERETLDYGDLLFEGAASTSNGEPISGIRADNGYDFAISQFDFAVADGWFADSTLGSTRTRVDRDLAVGFRVALPSTIFGGLQSTVTGNTDEWRLTYGEIGRLLGRSTLTFERTSGTIGGLGYSKLLGDGWKIGAQFYDLRDNDRVEDHQSVAGLVEKDFGSQLWQGRFLADSNGKFGGWLDTVALADTWTHRFGGLYLQPDLLWTNENVVNDELGLYFRSDRNTLRSNLSFGADYRETNIEDRSDRRGTKDFFGFVSGSRRISGRSSVGGTLRASHRTGKAGFNGGTGSGIDITGFTNQRIGVIQNKFQARYRNRPDTPEHRSQGLDLNWDGNWTIDTDRRLTAFAELRYADTAAGDANNSAIGMGWQQRISSSLGWSGTVSYNRQTRDIGPTIQSPRLNLAAYWQIARDWRLDMRVDLDRNRFSGNDEDLDFDENSLYITLRYDRSSGRSFSTIGGGSGASEVSGIVYFDENGDGVRQPNEQIAAGVPVLMNGRFTSVTDRNGRYTFFPVSAGDHQIELGLEDVPLPWTLFDEAPQTIRAGVRGTVSFDFPLIRPDQ